jgi:hypothetical protein
MAHAPILQQERIARRTIKAASIVAAQECIPVDDMPGWFQVRDVLTGSGAWHLATVSSCDCRDALKNVCKHQLACRAEEQALAAYAANWDAQTLPAELDDLPGSFLDGPFDAFDADVLTQPAPRGAVYKGQYFTAEQCDAAEQARKATCPQCGAATTIDQRWCGKSGWRRFVVCTRDAEHRARPA